MILSFLSSYFFSYINLLYNSENHHFFLFFIEKSYSFIDFFNFISWIFGYSFLPFLPLILYFYYKDSSKQIFLCLLFIIALDILFGSFDYGGAIGSCVFYNFNFWKSFILGFLLNFLSFFILFYPEIFYKKVSEIEKKVVRKKINKSLNDLNCKLPNVNFLSIGKKVKISINFEAQKELLLKTLKDFGISAKVMDYFAGPVVTLYSIELAPGIKSMRVINLASDIARSMETFSTRVSTIPGKNLLGVEISNPDRQFVYFKEGILSKKYEEFDGALPLYLGCNIYGEHEVFDLSTMPHLLVAGTTGSGKSVGIHTMLLSILYKLSAQDCKLILIDPKKLELTPYEDIPHLLLPVVTEAKEAIRAVKWAVNEMESRYKAMSNLGVRSIKTYNQKAEKFIPKKDEEKIEQFPYIVIVIDEMADLMLVAGKEFELYVQRLAQMGRACGIHIILATQRPSVDVITGTIKANFPARVSFKLSTKVDSRTILGDMSGAEQLLGAGDMLYLGNNGKITRIHGSFVSEEDVLSVVEFLKLQGAPSYIDLPLDEVEDMSEVNISGSGADDPYYEEAIKLIRAEQKVSTSFLQRHFPIGYNRAAKIIEKMEKEGIISKGDRFGRNREIF